MAIDFSQVKAITIPEGSVKKIEINGVTVWSPITYTISYRKPVYQSSTPASKTVPAGYQLTAADLPTGAESNANWQITGWTLDGTNAVPVGYTVNSNITLKSIHQGTITSANLTKTALKTGSGTAAHTDSASLDFGNVGNSTNNSTATYALKNTYSHSYAASSMSSDYYTYTRTTGWGGIVTNIYLDHATKISWTPSTANVTFTKATNASTSGTMDKNYTGTYPTMVVRYNDTGGFIYEKGQNNTNTITYTTGEPNSGSTIHVYIQYGGNTGGSQKLAWAGAYNRNSYSGKTFTISCNKSTATETIYLYCQ